MNNIGYTVSSPTGGHKKTKAKQQDIEKKSLPLQRPHEAAHPNVTLSVAGGMLIKGL